MFNNGKDTFFNANYDEIDVCSKQLIELKKKDKKDKKLNYKIGFTIDNFLIIEYDD